MSTEKLDTEIRKQQIIKASLDLIATEGIAGLNIAKLAYKVGLVPSAIYRHFKSKDEVIDTVLDDIHNKLTDNVANVCKNSSEPLERLSLLLDLHINLIRQNKAIPRLIFSEEVFSGHSGRKKHLYRIIGSYLDKVSEIIIQGQKSNKIRSDFSPETLSVMFLGLIQPNAILWHISDGTFDVTKQARNSWKIFSEVISTN